MKEASKADIKLSFAILQDIADQFECLFPSALVALLEFLC